MGVAVPGGFRNAGTLNSLSKGNIRRGYRKLLKPLWGIVPEGLFCARRRHNALSEVRGRRDWRRGGAGGIRGGSAPPWWFGRCRGFRPLLAEGNEAVALVPLYRERGQQQMPFYRSSPNKQTLNDSDEQLSLPLAIQDAPREVREHGLQEIHRFPLVSRGKGYAVFRKPARMAWRRYQEIELRTPNSFPALIFDVDTLPLDYLSIAFGASVRPPNWIVSNPETGHAHVVYCLARPVLHGDGMRQKPLKWRQRIAEFYRMAYRADRGYAGVLTHNPVHPKWETTWWRDEPWTLPELAEIIPKGWRIPRKPTTPEGRNVTLFNAALRWFGRPSNWDASTDLGDVQAWIGTRNAEWFNTPAQPPLDDNEVLWIAKSVCKISRKNLASGQTQQNFSFIQAAKGKRSGEVRRKGSIEEAEPWEAEGVSRRAWYYRQAGRHTGQHGGSRR